MENESNNLRALQLSELTVLDEVCRLCRENRIEFFITAGTLLGAVRHGGFIPWDDDVDVVMTRKNYKRFRKIALKGLGEGFTFVDGKVEKDYPFYFGKVRMDGTEVEEGVLRGFKVHKGCYVDIFPLDRCPTSMRRRKTFFKLCEVVSCAIIARRDKSFVCEYQKSSARLLFKLIKAMPLVVQKSLRGFLRAVGSAFSSGKTLATVSGSHGYIKESYRREWFSASTELDFEGRRLPAPAGYKELLTNMYGDYMTPPREDEREGHFTNITLDNNDNNEKGDTL